MPSGVALLEEAQEAGLKTLTVARPTPVPQIQALQTRVLPTRALSMPVLSMVAPSTPERLHAGALDAGETDAGVACDGGACASRWVWARPRAAATRGALARAVPPPNGVTVLVVTWRATQTLVWLVPIWKPAASTRKTRSSCACWRATPATRRGGREGMALLLGLPTRGHVARPDLRRVGGGDRLLLGHALDSDGAGGCDGGGVQRHLPGEGEP